MAKHKKSDFIDVKAVFKEYLSKWRWFVVSILVCGCLGVLVAKWSKPKYAINANILISEDNKSALGGLGALGDLFGQKSKVDDEIFVISSHSLLRDVVKSLGINEIHHVRRGFLNTILSYPDYPIDVIPAPGIIDTLRTPISFKIKIDKDGLANVKVKAKREVIGEAEKAKFPISLKTEYGLFVIDTTAYYTPGTAFKTTIGLTGFDLAAENLAKDVSTSIGSKRSNAIRMSMQTVNPAYGIDVLNKMIEKYNERGIAEKNLQSEKTAKFIDDRLKIISEDLNTAEELIQNYKEKKGIIDVEVEAKYQTEKRSAVETALINAETQAEVVRLTGEFLSNPGNAYSLIPMTTDNKGLQDGIQAFNELVLKRMAIASNAKPNNKALKLIDEQIDATRENIATSVNKVYDNLMVTVRDLRSQMNKAMGQLGTVPSQEREFLNLRRQQEVKQQLYLFLLQSREETAIMLANATPKGLIVDEAYALNRPVNLSKPVILIIFLLIGFCLPPLLIYLNKATRTKFESKEDVEGIVDVPVLGEICEDKSGRSIVTVAGDHSSTTELFNLLRSQLPFMLGDGKKVVLLTSTRSGEGKSYVSVNLAADMALLDKKVLLIGMDIRKPRLAEYLGIRPRFGLTQYLSSSEITLDQMITKVDQANGLDVIISGPIPPNPAELLNSQRLDKMMEELRQRYDYIFIDSAPVGMVSDTFTLNRLSDATIYVARANYTTRADLHFIDEIYEQKRLNKLCLVINGTKTKKGYGYGYGNEK